MIKKILERFSKSSFQNEPKNLLDEIQEDILGNQDLSTILRKAKVLAFRLKNQEFKDWVENELNGYQNDDLMPKYRTIAVEARGDFINSAWRGSKLPIPLLNIPSDFHHIFTEVTMFQGVKELESLIITIGKSKDDSLQSPIPPELLPLLSETIYEYMHCMGAWKVITKSNIAQIIETTRTALLNFILELTDEYPQIKLDTKFTKEIPNERIKQVFNYYILGGKQNIVNLSETTNQGDNMSIFDQREQKVEMQYNAARDINFNDVQDSESFVRELEKLKKELIQISENDVIDAEIVTDTEYQLSKAVLQSKKDEPNKTAIVKYLNNAKQLIDGVKVATGLVSTITKAIEVADKIFE